MKKAVVFSGGTVTNYDILREYLPRESFIICADSGIIHCNNLGMKTDMIVGDFDSSDYNEVIKLPASNTAEIIVLNPAKDDTDTEFALDRVVELGYDEVYLAGGIGTRLDHSLANIFLMEKYHKKGVILTLVNEKNILHYVCNESITINKTPMKYISVLPVDYSVRVSNDGFKYPLYDEIMYRNSTKGISNELTADFGIISVFGGGAVVAETID